MTIADLIERLSSPAALPVTQAAMWAERKQAADALRAAEAERAHWRCPTHGETPNAWGCPECVVELRRENERLKNTLQLHAGDTLSLSNEVDAFKERAEDAEEELAERRMNLAQAAEALRAAEAEVASKKDVIERIRGAAYRLGPWLAAALDDPGTCDEMKSAIVAWFEAL